MTKKPRPALGLCTTDKQLSYVVITGYGYQFFPQHTERWIPRNHGVLTHSVRFPAFLTTPKNYKDNLSMRRLCLAIFAASSLLLSACTTLHKGAEFSEVAAPRKDAALIYLYRDGVAPYWRSPTLLIDGKDVSEVKNTSFTYFYLPEGTHKIATRWALDLFPLNVDGALKVENGLTYYLKLGGGMMFMPAGGSGALKSSVSSNLRQVDRLSALREMKGCMYVPNALEQPSYATQQH